MSKPRFYTPRFCIDCGGSQNISYNAKRCKVCAILKQKQRDRERFTGEKSQRKQKDKLRYPVRIKPPVSPGSDYYCQMQSTDGQFYIIVFKCEWVRIKKVCANCHGTDETVKGKWAPIYSNIDYYGNEIDPVLLCLHCYDRACEKIAS